MSTPRFLSLFVILLIVALGYLSGNLPWDLLLK